MGNGAGKLTECFSGATLDSQKGRHVISAVMPDGCGHSFCYRQPDTDLPASSSSRVHSEEISAAFRISGASVGANTSTPPSTVDPFSCPSESHVSFQSSTSFAAVPLQPIPKWNNTLCSSSNSGPLDRGFLSGPMERGLTSGPISKASAGNTHLRRSFSHGFQNAASGRNVRSMLRTISRKLFLPRRQNNTVIALFTEAVKEANLVISKDQGSGQHHEGSTVTKGSTNLQWAQGRAGEDRIHIVVSEEHGWIFTGIYDGFNGPDAPDFLSSNLYDFVHEELQCLLSDQRWHRAEIKSNADGVKGKKDDSSSELYHTPKFKKPYGMKHVENHRRWKKHQWKRDDKHSGASGTDNIHKEVLEALSRALRRAEEAYLCAADKAMSENPELALMGSCVLATLMKGDEVYVMNVGDSRAVLARKDELGVGKIRHNLQMINEEPLQIDGEWSAWVPKLNAVQLSVDHCTSIKEEVRRIRREHPDDSSAVINGRVKGSLKVTRAFGVGFLKQPKWNNALLEMFRVNYIGSSPYISCLPSLRHHSLGRNDMFLILSSDGLFQYLTNEEAVREVELFLAQHPEGDPAQHLVEEVLFRAAEKVGMDFLELLAIPLGDRRQYHDDISIMVVSFEGRIWRSCT